MKTIIECLRDNPVIAAVNSDEGLEAALRSECEVVFILQSSVVTIAPQVERVKASGRKALAHIDLIDGFASREVVVDALRAMCAPDGVISTRPPLLRRAHQLGLTTVQRVFAIDSKSVANLKNLSETGGPTSSRSCRPHPAGAPRRAGAARHPGDRRWADREKSEVIEALAAGAVAVSTTIRAFGACRQLTHSYHRVSGTGKLLPPACLLRPKPLE